MIFIHYLSLIILFIVHWILSLISYFYVFVRKSNKYDYIYFITVSVIILSWLTNKQECIISYFEKSILNKKYQYGSDPTYHPSLTFYIKNNLFQTVLLTMASILMIINIAIMMKIYKVNIFVITLLLIIAILYTLYFRLIQVVSQQQKQFLATSKIPEWILNDPHLLGMYYVKVYKPISYQNIFCILTCYFDSLCIKKQLTWTDFEAHVKQLSTNLPEFDYIVGIETGGAFVAKYLSVITNKPVVYIKVSKYDDGKFWQKKPSVSIHSDLSVLKNKNVLIVDDHILTGDTLRKSKEIVEMMKPNKVYTGVLYQNRDHPMINYKGIKASMSRSPWGSAV
jgi:hypoxanthine phosphoribosyltransferase